MHHTTSCIALNLTSSYVPHNTTFLVLHATFQITPYIGHIMHTTTSRITPHFTHCTTFHMPLHILHSCIIPPHLTVIAPNSTSHYHVSHNIPHHTSVHHHFLHPTTCHISHDHLHYHVSRHVTAHTTSFHIAQRSTFHATAHTPIHITPQLSITPFQFERLELYVIRFVMWLSFTTNLLYHISN